MEVHGKNAGDSQAARRRVIEAQRDYYAAKQAQARSSGTANAAAGSDSIELSDPTTDAVETQRAQDEVRTARLEQLRAELFEQGTLNTPERVAAAAERILEG